WLRFLYFIRAEAQPFNNYDIFACVLKGAPRRGARRTEYIDYEPCIAEAWLIGKGSCSLAPRPCTKKF
ncbi:hypothetical protein AALP_AAs66330U000100, partial [Arabis alpina]